MENSTTPWTLANPFFLMEIQAERVRDRTPKKDARSSEETAPNFRKHEPSQAHTQRPARPRRAQDTRPHVRPVENAKPNARGSQTLPSRCENARRHLALEIEKHARKTCRAGPDADPFLLMSAARDLGDLEVATMEQSDDPKQSGGRYRL